MKIGLVPVNVGVPNVEAMVALAQKAEAVGLESVWTFEHAIVPNDYSSEYPYSADGKMGVTPDTNFVDPLIALSAIAQATKRVRLGTGVNILPQTNPLLLAKQAASLDFVSGGRFMLGVGIGWLKEEFAAMGTPFEKRGARFDDYVAAMRKVWSGETVEHQSERLHWTGFKSYPVPLQSPLPVVIGGSKGKAFERIAKYGEGWFAPTVSADQLKPMLKQLEEACAAEGRDPKSVEISAMWVPAMGLDALRQYEDVGVARLIIPLQALGGGNPLEALDGLASDVLAKL
jgi:probable F420-dependent oxidoreductase